MMLTILYIGRDAQIAATVGRLLNAREEWRGLTACSDEEALAICSEQVIDLVLLGNGILDAEEQELRKRLIKIHPSLKIIQHYGGGSGLLYGEIMAAI
jgi:DNA-binding NtrC family response regulator